VRKCFCNFFYSWRRENAEDLFGNVAIFFILSNKNCQQRQDYRWGFEVRASKKNHILFGGTKKFINFVVRLEQTKTQRKRYDEYSSTGSSKGKRVEKVCCKSWRLQAVHHIFLGLDNR
jgi:hypothetical protein